MRKWARRRQKRRFFSLYLLSSTKFDWAHRNWFAHFCLRLHFIRPFSLNIYCMYLKHGSIGRISSSSSFFISFHRHRNVSGVFEDRRKYAQRSCVHRLLPIVLYHIFKLFSFSAFSDLNKYIFFSLCHIVPCTRTLFRAVVDWFGVYAIDLFIRGFSSSEASAPAA